MGVHGLLWMWLVYKKKAYMFLSASDEGSMYLP